MSGLQIYLVTSCIYIIFDAMYFILRIFRTQGIYYSVYFYSACFIYMVCMFLKDYISKHLDCDKVSEASVPELTWLCCKLHVLEYLTALLACVQSCIHVAHHVWVGKGKHFTSLYQQDRWMKSMVLRFAVANLKMRNVTPLTHLLNPDIWVLSWNAVLKNYYPVK
jgi:hypothetical protein